MLWTPPATDNVMYQFAVSFVESGMSVRGYELPWAGMVETQPNPHDLHALITLA